jgi:endonuclease/exonuclease/phosphatase family metal-dependent hydrolase
VGDFNAKMGKENSLRPAVGNYSLHKTSSGNGMMLGQFAMRNNLVIKRICFPHKKIHLSTWKSPCAGSLNQIDHVLIAARHSSSIMDVRSCRGPNCDSDHYLVKTIVREKLTKTQEIHSMRRRRWHL